MELKSGEYSQVATDEPPPAKLEKGRGWSWKGEITKEDTLTKYGILNIPSKKGQSITNTVLGWQAFVALWLARTMNKMSDSYISSILSTVERHFGLNTKSMSMVKKSSSNVMC